MKSKDENELFSGMAKEYIEHEGKALHEELRKLNESNVSQATPKMDNMVLQLLNQKKKRRSIRLAVIAAAAVMLLLFVPRLMPKGKELAENMPQESTAIEETKNTDNKTSSPEKNSQEETKPSNVIPLSFSMPKNFSIKNVKQDRGQSVYFLENTENDDVVMTLEAKPLKIDSGELKELSIDNHKAYGKSMDGYSLLCFEKDNVSYTMTCEHDINTLIDLSKNIL